MLKLDGKWNVVYAEVHGAEIDGNRFSQATMKGNVVTYRRDGKETSWHIEFGCHQMVRCVEKIDGKTTRDSGGTDQNTDESVCHSDHGVCIASQQYPCLCLNEGKDRRNYATRASREGREVPSELAVSLTKFDDHGGHGAQFILFLHRSGHSTTSSSRNQ
jgi:hypothetical protein